MWPERAARTPAAIITIEIYNYCSINSDQSSMLLGLSADIVMHVARDL